MDRLGKILAGFSRWAAGGQPGVFSAVRLRRRERFRTDYEIVAGALLHRLEFDSMLDIGCANGFIMGQLKRAGKTVAGIDVSPEVQQVVDPDLGALVTIGDFSEATAHSDLVCCVEVAEHVLPDRSLELVHKLASLARRWIYFTAAPPGQLGFAHINCRPHEEWLEWFRACGWLPEPSLTSLIRNDLFALQHAVWLRRNSFVLARNGVPHPAPAANGNAHPVMEPSLPFP